MPPIADFDFTDEDVTVEIPVQTLAQLVFGEGHAAIGPDRPTRDLHVAVPAIDDVSRCSVCREPAHAVETDDLDRCLICARDLGDRGEIVDYDIPGIATVETDVSDLSDGVPCGIEFEDTGLHVVQVAVG
jgi:hypothetical protein